VVAVIGDGVNDPAAVDVIRLSRRTLATIKANLAEHLGRPANTGVAPEDRGTRAQ
jgi:hypothetical protein